MQFYTPNAEEINAVLDQCVKDGIREISSDRYVPGVCEPLYTLDRAFLFQRLTP